MSNSLSERDLRKPFANSASQVGVWLKETMKLAAFPCGSSIGYCAVQGPETVWIQYLLCFRYSPANSVDRHGAIAEVGYTDIQVFFRWGSVSPDNQPQSSKHLKPESFTSARKMKRHEDSSECSDTGDPCAAAFQTWICWSSVIALHRGWLTGRVKRHPQGGAIKGLPRLGYSRMMPYCDICFPLSTLVRWWLCTSASDRKALTCESTTP